jgi:hypothetical protein
MRLAHEHPLDGIQVGKKRRGPLAQPQGIRTRLAEIITGIVFKDGVAVPKKGRQEIAA